MGKKKEEEEEEPNLQGCEMFDVNGRLVRAVGPWHFRLQFGGKGTVTCLAALFCMVTVVPVLTILNQIF